VFEGMLFMQVTTVASVVEKNKNPKIFRRKQLLRTVFDRYDLINPTTHPHDPCATPHNNKQQRNSTPDSYGAPPRIRETSQRKQLLHVIFDRYILISPTIRPRNLPSTLHSNGKYQHAAPDVYRPLPTIVDFSPFFVFAHHAS